MNVKEAMSENELAGVGCLPPYSATTGARGRDPASFRDPSGFVFRGQDDALYRQVNEIYKPEYQHLMKSGLYDDLVSAGLLVEHEEVGLENGMSEDAHQIIRPRELNFISYPYEWSFSALKKAAEATLEIQQRALNCGMSLKDASAYNLQYEGNHPRFIDTLSFERYQPGAPWTAYGQFCRHFLAPLALMAYRDIRLNGLLALHMDGVPLDLASRLLPLRTRLRPGLLLHLHVHAKMVARYAGTSRVTRQKRRKPARLSEFGLRGVIGGLQRCVAGLNWRATGGEWMDYYENNSYKVKAQAHKEAAVSEFLDELKPKIVWDLGANTGLYSRIACGKGARTIAVERDPACVERMFVECGRDGRGNLLPLCIDLENPSAAIGWAHRERRSLAERGPADVVLALALIHHLAIANNLPLAHIAEFLSRIGEHLIIEFVPKHDPQVARLLRSRKDIFDNYGQRGFEAAFHRHFSLLKSQALQESGRVLYLWKSRP